MKHSPAALFKILKLWIVPISVFCCGVDLFSQCIPESALECSDAPVFCALSDLNGYQCRNPSFANPSGPSPLCPEGGVPNNLSWWAFVSGGGPVEIRITTLTCSASLNPGIQAGIYSNCDFDTPIACLAECFTGSESLIGHTESCQTYYVFIDGCNGANCDYMIEVISGLDPPEILQEPTMDVRTLVCPGEEVCANAMVLDQCASDFIWTLNGVISDNQGSQYCERLSNPGTYQLCVQAILGNRRNVCQVSPQICTDILVEEIPIQNLPDEFICFEDRNGIFFTQCASPVPHLPGSYSICCRIVRPGGCIQEICKNFVIHPPIDLGYEPWFFCEKSKVVLPDGNEVEKCGQYIMEIPGGSRTGCDSSYVLDLRFLVPNISFEAPTCEKDAYCISAQIDMNCFDELPAYEQVWTTGEVKDTLVKGKERICADVPGKYCYHFSLDLEGVPCIRKKVCISIPLSSWVDWGGSDTVCSNSFYHDTIRVQSSQIPDRYEWSVNEGWILGSETDSFITWQSDIIKGTVEICCQAYLGECLLADTCLIRWIEDEPNAGINWKQEGNSLILSAVDSIGTSSVWTVNGTEYSGTKLKIPANSNEIFSVVHQISNQCASATSQQKIPFLLSQAFDKKKPEELNGIKLYPLTPQGAFSIRTSHPSDLAFQILDLSGKLILSGEWSFKDEDELIFSLPDRLPSGIYFLLIAEIKTGSLKSFRLPKIILN